MRSEMSQIWRCHSLNENAGLEETAETACLPKFLNQNLKASEKDP